MIDPQQYDFSDTDADRLPVWAALALAALAGLVIGGAVVVTMTGGW